MRVGARHVHLIFGFPVRLFFSSFWRLLTGDAKYLTMLGISTYESDDEAPSAAQAASATARPSQQPIPGRATNKPLAPASTIPSTSPGAPQQKPAALATAEPATEKKSQHLPPNRLRDIRKELRNAKSATAVVHTARKYLASDHWDVRWGAESMLHIAKRSTARTRREWTLDATVKDIAERLKSTVLSAQALSAPRRDGDVETVLVSLEGLRRMGLQEVDAQRETLETVTRWLVAANWEHPAKSLAQLYWLAAPMALKGPTQDLVPAELRKRAQDLDGPDVYLLLAAMRNKNSRDGALLDKVVARLRVAGIHAGLSATDLVELAEGLCELGIHDQDALRPLGQEALRRRSELTPDESHRIHTAFQTAKLPLPTVWTEPGAAKKRDNNQIVTTTAFIPQEGHEKKRRGNQDIERTSPPRVVRDYKMMSY